MSNKFGKQLEAFGLNCLEYLFLFLCYKKAGSVYGVCYLLFALYLMNCDQFHMQMEGLAVLLDGMDYWVDL